MSYWVWSIVPFLAKGEAMMAGRRLPGPQRSASAARRDPRSRRFRQGDDDEHMIPLRALFQMRDDIGQMLVAAGHIRIAACSFRLPCGL